MKGKGIIFLDIFICLFVTIVVAFIMLNIIFPLKYKNTILACANQNQVGSELVASIIFTESRFNPSAKSSKGACGLMQLLPSTAKAFYKGDKDYSDDMLFDPEINIKIGVSYLKYLFDKYQDEVTVLACYNAGEGKVLEWKGQAGVLKKSQIPYRETLNYVNKVQKIKKYYKFKI